MRRQAPRSAYTHRRMALLPGSRLCGCRGGECGCLVVAGDDHTTVDVRDDGKKFVVSWNGISYANCDSCGGYFSGLAHDNDPLVFTACPGGFF